jgi:hypothetical protein
MWKSKIKSILFERPDMKDFINSILTTLTFVFFIINLQAQQAIREGTFTIGKNTYGITKSKYTPTYIVENIDISELKPNPLEANGFPTEYIRTKMTNEKELQKMACEALGKDKREQLTAAKEKISGLIYYRADGSVINMVFSIQENTVLTLDDLARVERTLQQRFKASFESDPPNFHLHLYYISKNYELDFGKVD